MRVSWNFSVFTGITDEGPKIMTLDKFEPSNKDDFAEFQKMLVEKITKYEVCTQIIFLVVLQKVIFWY